MNRIFYFALITALLFTFISCDEEPEYVSTLPGLWQLDETYVNDIKIDNEANAQIRLLVEPSGLYRNNNFFRSDSILSTYGTWFITDNKWIDFTADSWRMMDYLLENVSGSWMNIHTPFRFTILELNDTKMTLRISCAEAEIKYSSLFKIVKNYPVVGVNDQVNKERIMSEYRTVKKFVFHFSKVNY